MRLGNYGTISKLFFARSEYEANYLNKGYDISKDKIAIVPLSYRQTIYNPNIQKEPFCLFAGTMTQERKNVPRLIEAAKKYGFNLNLLVIKEMLLLKQD